MTGSCSTCLTYRLYCQFLHLSKRSKQFNKLRCLRAVGGVPLFYEFPKGSRYLNSFKYQLFFLPGFVSSCQLRRMSPKSWSPYRSPHMSIKELPSDNSYHQSYNGGVVLMESCGIINDITDQIPLMIGGNEHGGRSWLPRDLPSQTLERSRENFISRASATPLRPLCYLQHIVLPGQNCCDKRFTKPKPAWLLVKPTDQKSIFISTIHLRLVYPSAKYSCRSSIFPWV